MVTVPAGIADGQTLNIRGEGEAGYRGGARGDLYVTIRVKPHKLFERQGYDLYLTMNIPFTTAALGGEIKVPTLTGAVKYNIPEGTQTGTTFRMREQGVQRLRGSGKGDLLVKVEVEVPKRLNDAQRQALAAYAALMGEGEKDGETGKKKGFFKK